MDRLVTRRHAPRRTGLVLALVVLVAVAGGVVWWVTTSQRGGDDAPGSDAVSADRELRAELVQMKREDQAERTGAGLPPGTKLPPSGDYGRVQRLKDIVEESGWPTISTVGREGAEAAWVVAQHADFDVSFQETALALMRDLAERGEADRTDAAYLADRVAVNRGRPQTYGTQVGCSEAGPRPSTPLAQPGMVVWLRLSAGMQPLTDYYAEMTPLCEEEAAAGAPVPGS